MAERMVWRNRAASASGVEPEISVDGPLICESGLTMDRVFIASGNATGTMAPTAPEVLFVQSGELKLNWARGEVMLGQGDTITVPVGLSRELSSETGCHLYRVSR